MPGDQLLLHYEPGAYHAHHWRRVRAEMARVFAHVTLKQAAYDLDTTPSHISHAMNERDRKSPRAEWLVYCLTKAPDLDLARAVADTQGLEVSRRAQLTPEEKLDRLEGVLAESLGPDLRAAILRKAYDGGQGGSKR